MKLLPYFIQPNEIQRYSMLPSNIQVVVFGSNPKKYLLLLFQYHLFFAYSQKIDGSFSNITLLSSIIITIMENFLSNENIKISLFARTKIGFVYFVVGFSLYFNIHICECTEKRKGNDK